MSFFAGLKKSGWLGFECFFFTDAVARAHQRRLAEDHFYSDELAPLSRNTKGCEFIGIGLTRKLSALRRLLQQQLLTQLSIIRTTTASVSRLLLATRRSRS